MEESTLFLAERKVTFDEFLRVHHEYVAYRDKLHDLVSMALLGEEPGPGTLESFPDSPLARLTECLRHVRRVAKSYAVIHAADSMVQLHGDMATMEKHLLSHPEDPNNEISRFLLARFVEDREKEFIYAYRAELGLGIPEGAPFGYGAPRHPNLNHAETVLRSVSPAFARKPPSEAIPPE